MSMTETDVVKALQPPTYTNKETGITYTGRLLSLPQFLDFAPDTKKLAAKEMSDADFIQFAQKFFRALFPLPVRTTPFTSIKWLELVRQKRYERSLEGYDDAVQHMMNDPEIVQVFADFLVYQTSVINGTARKKN